MSSFVHNSDNVTGREPDDGGALPSPVSLVHEDVKKVLADFPNDLSRLIYLASLRDYNTGNYLHPDLSHRHALEQVAESFQREHENVFRRLLSLPLRSYVDQLLLYIAFAGVTSKELIATWKDLAAYRSAVPLAADKIAAEIFHLNVFSALMVLEGASSQTGESSHGL